MARYMDQELFNSVVLRLAAGRFIEKTKPEAHSITQNYLYRYVEYFSEDDFLPEAEDCARRTVTWLQKHNLTGAEQTLQWLISLYQASQKYKPDGERRPVRLFGGLWFNSKRRPLPDRNHQCFKDLGCYFLNLQAGKIEADSQRL